jgi:hypothetical protein
VSAVCFLIATLALIEGVTHRTGEGNFLPEESSAKIQERLELLSIFIGIGVVGWSIFRASDRRILTPGRTCRVWLIDFVADGLLFLGGICLVVPLLILAASISAKWSVPKEYWWLAGGSLLSMPFWFAIGFWLAKKGSGLAGMTRALGQD